MLKRNQNYIGKIVKIKLTFSRTRNIPRFVKDHTCYVSKCFNIGFKLTVSSKLRSTLLKRLFDLKKIVCCIEFLQFYTLFISTAEFISSVIRQKGESQNDCHKKVKYVKLNISNLLVTFLSP